MSENLISNIQVYVIKEPKGKLRAMARLVLAESMQLTGLRIYDGSNGLFVSYPNDPSYKGDDYKQLYYPIESKFRENIENAVLEEYEIANKA